jgi:hypothetical protein
MMLWGIYGPGGDEVTGRRENCIIRSCMISTIQFLCGIPRKRDHLENPGNGVWIILNRYT